MKKYAFGLKSNAALDHWHWNLLSVEREWTVILSLVKAKCCVSATFQVSFRAMLIKEGCNCRNDGVIFVNRRKVYLNYIYYWGSYIYERRAKSRAVVLLAKSEQRYILQ